jgi:iron complex transport system substrate-binding protein
MPIPRIVSLLASSTEIVCALGFENFLVGRSHECDFPPWVKRLPVCTKVKFDTNGNSREIDARVKSVLEEGESLYWVDEEKLKALSPTHVFTQAQCEVCAVSLKDVEKAVRSLPSKPIVVALNPNSMEEIFSDIRRMAHALQAEDKGDVLVDAMKKRMQEITQKANAQDKRLTVACIEWLDPLMAAGNWVPELVKMAGGNNQFGVPGKHSPWMQWSELVRKDPEIILIFPCGFDISRTKKEMKRVVSKPEWQKLSAVQLGKVFLLDGNQYFNRPGPRLVESLEMLAEIFHPEIFHFGHEGIGWIQFTA